MDEELRKAEELIASGDLDGAQKLLDGIEEESGRKHYVQSKVFKARNWVNEERKQLQFALNKEPENELYRSALEELENFAAGESQFNDVKPKKRWDGCAEACCEGGCLCCGEGACQLICEGLCS